jgi:hypothetical protein
VISLFTRLLLLCAFFTITGCGDDQRKITQKTLRQVGANNLRREAATFYKELFVAPTGQYFLPKPEQWPPSFRRFEPLRVRAYADGFSLAIRDTRKGEVGLYVVPLGMDKTPREGRNSQFQKIDEGLYWYSFSE